MPTLDDIRTAIAAGISSVPGVGMVHTFERFAKANSEFRPLYESAGKILGWNVRRVRTEEKSDAAGQWMVTHTWSIKGFMGLDDGGDSELVFDRLVEAIRDRFRADETLGGVVDTTVVEDVAGIQVDDSGPVMFAGVLCHSVKLRLVTRHWIQG